MAGEATGFEHLSAWIGRQELRDDVITSAPAAALAATLDLDAAPAAQGDELPPLWHWLYFLPVVRQSQVGADGHPERGGFLPPVELPRRMWAGSQLTFHLPLVIGEHIRRDSTITDIKHKHGRSGDLIFVVVRHEIHGNHGCAITEDQQIVYRGVTGSSPVTTAAPEQRASGWQRTVHPDPVLLFRYSALTFNGHRIHYDRPYAMDAEGYPGLVVHGPLLATLMLDGLRKQHPDREVAKFEFRAQRPLFDTEDFAVAGRMDADDRTCTLWAADMAGVIAMDAQAVLAT